MYRLQSIFDQNIKSYRSGCIYIYGHKQLLIRNLYVIALLLILTVYNNYVVLTRLKYEVIKYLNKLVSAFLPPILRGHEWLLPYLKKPRLPRLNLLKSSLSLYLPCLAFNVKEDAATNEIKTTINPAKTELIQPINAYEPVPVNLPVNVNTLKEKIKNTKNVLAAVSKQIGSKSKLEQTIDVSLYKPIKQTIEQLKVRFKTDAYSLRSLITPAWLYFVSSILHFNKLLKPAPYVIQCHANGQPVDTIDACTYDRCSYVRWRPNLDQAQLNFISTTNGTRAPVISDLILEQYEGYIDLVIVIRVYFSKGYKKYM